MSVKEVVDGSSAEFQYFVKYVIEGFSKLAAQSWNQENEILYQSSRDYAETPLEDWTPDIYTKALLYLSKHILNPRHSAKILFIFEQCIFKILRYALASDADHQTKCSALRIILKYRPYILQHCLSYFDGKKAPWERDNVDSKAPKKMKLANSEVSDLEIVECCWIFLKTNLNYFKNKWNWSDFMNKYLNHNDIEICWFACQSSALVLGMNESAKLNLIEKYMTLEKHYDFALQYEVEKQSSHSIALETLIYDLNPSRVFMPLYKQKVCGLTVSVAGVSLSIKNPENQVKEGCLVETASTQYNLRRAAVAVQTRRGICLVGPVGSGKTSLVSHLALLTGRNLSTDLLKVQLGEETDSKLLLGSYQCTDIPGEFVWSPGMLTKAVLEGRWLLLEDIENATSDVAALLANLLQENSITIPGFRDSVRPAPGFQLFMTHRLVSGLSLHQRRDTSSTEPLERHWFRINLEPLTRDELVHVIQTKYPLLKTIAAQMVSVFLLFSKGNHEDEDSVLIHSGGRLISTRDLFKWCQRAVIGFDVSSVESALKVLQDAIDIFCCSYNSEEKRLELAGEVAACLGIIKMKAEYFCQLYKPSINLTATSCVAGRAVVPRIEFSNVSSLKSLIEGLKFALTRGSACLLERVAVCLSLDEPALLVGETGTGKTTTLQLLAKQTGHKLVVINMNQQSDSSDLLGGYKPIDTKQVVMPLRDEFEGLFRSFFNVEKNLKFLENISVCISNKRWLTLLKLMITSQKAALKRLSENKNDDALLSRWLKLGEKMHKLQTQLKQNEAAMAFSFVEGSLIQAMKAGYWVLLDEINLASAETLQCLSGLLEGSTIHLLERGDEKSIAKHPDFRIMAAMNPATDFGKKDLPPGIRNRFTEIFVFEHTEKGDLALMVNCYLPDHSSDKVDAIVDFYLKVRKCAVEILSDGSGNRPHFSLRTLCRALVIASENRCGSMARSLYEGFCLSFLTQLNPASHAVVRGMIAKTAADKGSIKSILSQPIPEPVGKQKYIQFEGYWVSKGEYPTHVSKKYILTENVRRNLCDLARIVSLSNHSVLIQGGTSVGKTSLVIYLAEASGHKVLRINNHQHTDLQEYVGSYCADSQTGSLIFKEGVLAQAMRRGDWIILDELNLAPSEVLEALNRVLDDNRELFIPETSVTIKAHPDFRIFATQNPPGTYGGRKMLSRAFRNRFVELHFGEIPNAELQEILHQRCHMPRSYCQKLVDVMADLQRRRRGSATFAGKEGYITLRDLFRWGERYRLATSFEHLSYHDWDQHVADEGYLVLAGRVRKKEEQDVIQNVIEKRFKRTIDLNKLFSLSENTSPVTKHILEKIVLSPLPEQFKHLVWTFNLRKLAVLVGKALEFKEPILLVGETGCGKTTICQLLAVINCQLLYSVNCHQHSESSDFLGGLRPVRDVVEKSGKLFEWVDGPLIKAMKEGHIFLVDEISLADDSVLERLNSLLEPERKLLVSEKGSGDDIEVCALDNFHFIGTMNPGGDFGKKELSPALRNRLTEIWCEAPNTEDDLVAIVDHNMNSDVLSLDVRSRFAKALVQFVLWFSSTDLGKRISISVRDLLVWVHFINVTVDTGGLDAGSSYLHGACLTLLDGIGSANTSTDNVTSLKTFKEACMDFLLKQLEEILGSTGMAHLNVLLNPEVISSNLCNSTDKFGIHPFYIKKVSPGKAESFMFNAPTTCLNVLRLLRAVQVASRAILLEGSPGVGKTSLVLALAETTGNKVTRINLSEQTDISDLFGTDLPVEGAEGGTFAWSDGPFLRALKEGHWILLDELNLASQSVIEGLNSVLDHRGEIYIPDLGRSFQVKPEETKLFACQNPQRQGGARKGLPRSFLNRFTQVFVEPLTDMDLEVIVNGLYPDVKSDLLKKMVDFHNRICSLTFSSPGFWEFNLRDLIRWGESFSQVVPGVAVETIYGSRMPSKSDRTLILDTYREVFGSSYPLASSLSPVLMSPTKITIGEVSLPRLESNDCYDTCNGKDLLVLRDQQPVLKLLTLCVKMGWMAILVGKSGSGKTSLVHVLAQLAGKKLNTIPVSAAMDTTDLLGGFEQTDLWRHLERAGRATERLVREHATAFLLGQEPREADTARLYSLWHLYLQAYQTPADQPCYEQKASVERFLNARARLERVLEGLPASAGRDQLISKLQALGSLLDRSGLQAGGVFEWVDSLLIKCVEEGEWLLLENVNLCSGAVLDRLNSLLEKGGSLALGERGSADHTINPHPDFRIFLTLDPKHGSISRAMRNRGVEIYLDVPFVSTMHPFDLDSILYSLGLNLDAHRKSLRKIHCEIVEKNIGPEQPGLHHLLQLAYISCQNWKQGFPLYDSIEKASLDVYIKSRTLSSDQRKLLKSTLKEVLEQYKKPLSESLFTTLDCFWALYKTPSTLSLQEDSHSAIARQHSAVIYSILRNFEWSKFMSSWPKDFSLKSILGSELSSYQHYSGSKHINLNYDILTLIPYLITCYYCCATSVDVLVRKKWLDKTINNIIRNHPYPDSLTVIFDRILHISNIIYDTLSPWKVFKERPWDVRHITNVNYQSPLNNYFSRENKIFTHICYRLICAPFQADEERESTRTKWKLMSVNEYSRAVEIGNVDKWPYQNPLVLELFPLLSAFDDLLVSALNSESVALPNDKCSDLIYKLAWRFKLSTAAGRRLFKATRTTGAPPAVCEETIAMLKLHYSWFKKHTVPAMMDLTQGCSDLSVKVHDFQEILNSIDSSLDDGSIHMMPIARKFRKLLSLPSPKSSTLQCDVSKKMQSIESEVDIWRSSSKLISKINFLATDAGEDVRNRIIRTNILLLENKDLDIVNRQASDVESSLKILIKGPEESVGCGPMELMRIKTWPLLEVVCAKLCVGVRRGLATGARGGQLETALTSWLTSIPSTPPSTAASIQVLLASQCPGVSLAYFLTDYPNTSRALAAPLALLDWEHTLISDSEGYTFLDNKSYYMTHMPLVSLFLSKIMAGFSSQQDTPSFALKAHKNMMKMFHVVKLLIWRNLPAMFSPDLCDRLNETFYVKSSYISLLMILKKAFNFKKKDMILGNDPHEVSKEIKGILEKMITRHGSYSSDLERLKPAESILGSLSQLESLIPELEHTTNSLESWLAIGQALSHIGRIHLLLFSLLELVDPVKKKALKKQYVSEEISELRVLLCAEELNKLLIGAPPSWPLKEEHEKRIALLDSKYSDSDRVAAIRPSVSLYSYILQDIINLTTVLVSDEVFTSRLSSLVSVHSSNVTKDEMETKFAEIRSWLTSLLGISEKFYHKYYVEYPDIITPVLMAMAQITHGLKLVWTCAHKHMLQKSHRGNFSIQQHLKILCEFPICGLNPALEVLKCCSSNEIVNLLNKSHEELTNLQEQENKIKLIKIGIKIIKSISQTHVMKLGTNTFFQVLDHVVLCWHQIQEQEKIKKAQEDSIYINRMKLTEEELLEREMREIFPSTREKDFFDLEVPETLEGLGESPKEEKESEPLKLRQEEIEEVVVLHAEVVRAAKACSWLVTSDSLPDSPLDLLGDRLAVFSRLIAQHCPAADGEELDPSSAPSLLLIASLSSQSTETQPTPSQNHYNFYRDSNISESKACIPLLNAILKRIKELLVEWPDHPTLNQIMVVVERILGFSMGSPLSRFLTGLELLLTKLHAWEEHAHSGVSLAQHQTSLTQQIIQWRRLELSAWKGALFSASRRMEGGCRKYWFHLYSLVSAFTRAEGEPVPAEIEELVKTLEMFMEGSSLGEYGPRLELLFTFHCHAILLPPSNRRSVVINVLWNVYSFYKLFSCSVLKAIEDLTADVKDKVKKFVKIARWNDINYWAVKSAVEKTHRTLLKHIKDYEKILNEPARGAMTKMEVLKSISKINLSGLKSSNYLTTAVLPESYIDKEGNEEILFYRLNSLLRKSRNLSSRIIKNCIYSKLLDNFEILIEDVEETGKLLNELDVDPTIPKEKKKSAFKSLLQKKRKAISDLFKILTQIGLSYRSGVIMFEQKNIDFAKIQPFDVKATLEMIDNRKSDKDWLECWKGAESYFYSTVAKLASLKVSLEKPHRDLGPQSIERIKGFSSHSNNLLHNLKETLAGTTLSLSIARCQLSQLKKITKTNFGIIDSDFSSNKENLREALEDVLYCMKQFTVLLEACPEQEVKFNEDHPVPLIFSDSGKHSMVSAFKHDPVWESTKAKAEAIINSCMTRLKQLTVTEKHRSFAKNISSHEMNVDIIISEKSFIAVEDGYDDLKKMFMIISDLEKCFELNVEGKVLTSPFTASLEKLKTRIDSALAFHKKIDLLSESTFNNFDELISSAPGPIKEKLESFLNKALCIIQNVYKSHVLENILESSECKPSGEPVKTTNIQEETEIIVDGHLKEKIVDRLMSDINSLRISEISEEISKILSAITSLPKKLEKYACQGLLYHMHPILDQLISVYSYFIVHLTGSMKSLGKFSAYLVSVFIEFSKNGYRIPEEMMEGEEEGEGESQTKGGLGLGEGEGEKDVSDQIESEDQLEDARRPGDYGQEEEKDCKEEEKGINMSENFDSKLQDLEKKEEEEKSDAESDKEEELDKEMGETEKGADTLDKEIWGSDSEEEPEDETEEPPKEEKGDKGEQQTEKELGAGEDEDKDEVGEKEDGKRKQPKEKEINDMEDQEIDDDQIDPYHGKQQPSPEVEPLEIEDEEMALDDEEEKGSEGEDEENPFDIDTMKKNIDDKQTEEPENEEKEDLEKYKNPEEDDGSDGDEPTPQVQGPEKEPLEEETNEEEIEGPKEEEGKEAEKEEEDPENKLGHEESEGADEQPSQQKAEKSEKAEGSKDQVKDMEDTGADGETAPEESQAEGKEESGSGKAEKMEIDRGGHRGETGKRKNKGDSEHEKRKQKPGVSEMERTLGEVSEPMKKKLKTIAMSKEGEEDKESREPEEKMEEDTSADLYQHIREAKETSHDTQTVDAATQEQAEKQPPTIGKEDEEKEELSEDEEINVLDDDDIEVDVETIPEQQSSQLDEVQERPEPPSKNKGEGGGPLEEAKVEVEGEHVLTATVARGMESSYHTRISEATQQPMSEAELFSLRKELENQLGTWSQPPETAEATAAWEKVCSLTNCLAQQLSEELRLVLEPTTASSLRGDFRTGKRINMRKVIPYIASQFRKDKIWLRRTKPSKREYQIILAIDDSSSMADNHSKELAFESLAVVSKALSLIEAGELAVLSFGEKVRVLHQLGEPFTESTGARLMQEFSFDEKRTRVGAAVEAALGLLSQRGPDSAQLLVIISDGRGVNSEGEQIVRSAVRKASHSRLFIVFLIIDSPNSKDSVLDIRMAKFTAGNKLEMKSYIDNFPFPFYLILRDISSLPSVLSDALRQWFELVTDVQ